MGVTLLAVLFPAAGQAQCISLTAASTAYTQDFNSLENRGTSSTLPAGWAISETGTNANATYSTGTGSSNAGDTYKLWRSGEHGARAGHALVRQLGFDNRSLFHE